MRIPLFKRIIITLCNIFFPPLAVGLLTGFTSRDTLLNACLFLLAIIPSHIHGFYISAVYFTRKRRVRNGKWPGKPRKTGVWSEKVLTGGAGWERAAELKGEKIVAGTGGGGVNEGYGSDFDNRRRRSRSKRDSRGVGGNGYGSKRSSKRMSGVQSGTQEPNGAQTYVQTPMQEMGRVTSAGTQGSRNSRRF